MSGASLPSLASLRETLPTNGPARHTVQERIDEWWASCGRQKGPPEWAPWRTLRGRKKELSLHEPAEKAAKEAKSVTEAEGESGVTFVSPYDETPIADLAQDRKSRSVEHVLPRSHVNGSAPGQAEDDPNAWVVASRHANSTRGNLPLVLWDEPELKSVDSKIVFLDGEAHFCPPLASRARLARVWIYTRATYGTIDSIDEPSEAQKNRWESIVLLMKKRPPDRFEIVMARIRRRRHNGWANPLCVSNSEWLDEPRVSDLEMLVFEMAAQHTSHGQ